MELKFTSGFFEKRKKEREAQQLNFGFQLRVRVWLIKLKAFPILPTDFVPAFD